MQNSVHFFAQKCHVFAQKCHIFVTTSRGKWKYILYIKYIRECFHSSYSFKHSIRGITLSCLGLRLSPLAEDTQLGGVYILASPQRPAYFSRYSSLLLFPLDEEIQLGYVNVLASQRRRPCFFRFCVFLLSSLVEKILLGHVYVITRLPRPSNFFWGCPPVPHPLVEELTLNRNKWLSARTSACARGCSLAHIRLQEIYMENIFSLVTSSYKMAIFHCKTLTRIHSITDRGQQDNE